MITELEVERILILKYVPKDIILRFFKDHSDDYDGGYSLGEEFTNFLSVLDKTNLAKKKESIMPLDEGIANTEYDSETLNHVFSFLLENKSRDFVIGFIRFIMRNSKENVKNILFSTNNVFIKDWFKENGNWIMNQMQEGTFENYINNISEKTKYEKV